MRHLLKTAEYREGALAYTSGKTLCPYQPTLGVQAVRWRCGWTNAFACEELGDQHEADRMQAMEQAYKALLTLGHKE